MLESNRFFPGLAILMAVSWLTGCARDDTEPEPEAAIAEGIAIEFPRDNKDMPLGWRISEKPPIVAPIPKEQTAPATKIIADAIAVYPDGFLPEHLTNVYVYSDMVFGGDQTSAGVSAEPSSIFLSYYTADPFWLELMFHWLVGELLYIKHKDLVEQVGFVYPITVSEEDLADVWLERDEKFVEMGYLFPLAARSVDEDFSICAGALMAGSRTALEDAKNHKLIAEKVEKVKKFFLLLDERFTEEFFRQRAENGHRGY